MILVVGGTGMVGSEICRILIEKGVPIRAMVRETAEAKKVEQLKKLGADVVFGDLRDQGTFNEALRDINAVITTISSMPFSYVPGENDIESVDREGMKNFIDFAGKAGVAHFIYTSFSGQLDLDFPLRNAKRDVEEHLKKSGMNYSILRPSCFMEVWLSPAVGFDYPNDKAQLCGDGSKTVSYISYLDVAKFAAECLENPAAVNKTLELGGPEKISQLDAVKIFEEIGNTKIEVSIIPEEALDAQRASAEDPMQRSFSGLMLCVAQGDPIDMEKTLSDFPIKMTSVREYAENVLKP